MKHAIYGKIKRWYAIIKTRHFFNKLKVMGCIVACHLKVLVEILTGKSCNF
jgi:hypothetical protein